MLIKTIPMTTTPGIQPQVSISLHLINTGAATPDEAHVFDLKRDGDMLDQPASWQNLKKTALDVAFQHVKVDEIPVYVKLKTEELEETQARMEKAGLQVVDQHPDPKHPGIVFLSFVKKA